MKPANNAPLYAMVYAKLVEIARAHGYAMAAHGSLAKDLDLICVPWVKEAAEPQTIVDAITSRFVLRVIDSPTMKLHNRLCYTLSFGGDVFLDLSFMPRAATEISAPPKDLLTECHEALQKCGGAFDAELEMHPRSPTIRRLRDEVDALIARISPTLPHLTR